MFRRQGVALVIPPEDLSTRSEIILTLLLTAVAFKMAIASSLPQLSYLTMVDKCECSRSLCVFFEAQSKRLQTSWRFW